MVRLFECLPWKKKNFGWTIYHISKPESKNDWIHCILPAKDSKMVDFEVRMERVKDLYTCTQYRFESNNYCKMGAVEKPKRSFNQLQKTSLHQYFQSNNIISKAFEAAGLQSVKSMRANGNMIFVSSAVLLMKQRETWAEDAKVLEVRDAISRFNKRGSGYLKWRLQWKFLYRHARLSILGISASDEKCRYS